EEEKPQRVNLLGVNEDFEGKRNTGNLCKRVKHKVYFVVLQRASPNLGYQIYFLVTPFSWPLISSGKNSRKAFQEGHFPAICICYYKK
ncbi:MAG: hypothetical protein IJY44_04795, partial [Bacteroidaceae bacterium]|nr:hypothetical protein [Bacteroidaceae bacterium]